MSHGPRYYINHNVLFIRTGVQYPSLFLGMYLVIESYYISHESLNISPCVLSGTPFTPLFVWSVPKTIQHLRSLLRSSRYTLSHAPYHVLLLFTPLTLFLPTLFQERTICLINSQRMKLPQLLKFLFHCTSLYLKTFRVPSFHLLLNPTPP